MGSRGWGAAKKKFIRQCRESNLAGVAPLWNMPRDQPQELYESSGIIEAHQVAEFRYRGAVHKGLRVAYFEDIIAVVEHKTHTLRSTK
jgi:hypothetical protein